MLRAVRALAFVLLLPLLSCAAQAGHGEMGALAPILGGGALARAPKTEAREPVEDLWVDLTDLSPAWPSVAVELPRMLGSLIARGSWVDEHHTATRAGTGLRVRHRPDVLAEVRRLLGNLRASLLRPIDIEVSFVELPLEALPSVLPPRPGARWDMAAFHARAAASKDVRSLGRLRLSAYNGQWVTGERMSNQAVLAGITIEGGGVVPQTVSLASGITLQAAAWRWGEERSVVALTAAVTGPVSGGQSVTQKVHRALPEKTKNHPEWEPHELALELPIRELFETQTEVTVARGEWTAVSVVPSGKGRVAATLVRVDWPKLARPLERIDPRSGAGYVLEQIPIALPTQVRAGSPEAQLEIDNLRSLEDSAAGWMKQRAEKQAETQKRATYNFQEADGELDVSAASQASQGIRVKGGPAAPAAEGGTEALEALSAEITTADWPPGTALEFTANQVFVVHREEIAAKLRRLLDGTHAFSNRTLPFEVGFVTLGAADADAAPRDALKTASRFLPGARLLARHATCTDAFAGQMHTVLAAPWPADRSSPKTRMYWQGARIGVCPSLGEGGAADVDLRLRLYRLDRLPPSAVGGATLQLPKDSIWPVDEHLRLAEGPTVVTVAGDAEAVQAVTLEVVPGN